MAESSSPSRRIRNRGSKRGQAARKSPNCRVTTRNPPFTLLSATKPLIAAQWPVPIYSVLSREKTPLVPGLQELPIRAAGHPQNTRGCRDPVRLRRRLPPLQGDAVGSGRLSARDSALERAASSRTPESTRYQSLSNISQQMRANECLGQGEVLPRGMLVTALTRSSSRSGEMSWRSLVGCQRGYFEFE